MDATTMPSTLSLLERLSTDFPEFSFASGSSTAWEPNTRTIRYRQGCSNAELLHELGHALEGHSDYSHDITLLGLERDAWQRACALASQYEVIIDDEMIDTHLDTYRDWLHARSTCPACDASGIQVAAKLYECPSCSAKWSVNEARSCRLQRRQLK